METKPKRSPLRNLLFTLIMLLVLFVIVEIILSVFLYHKHGNEKLATIETLKVLKRAVKGNPSSINVDNQELVRPEASEAMNKKIAEETQYSNQFAYEPWIEFRNIDYKGEFVNVSASQRKSIPEIFINPASADTLDIFFFGGSTTFGFNVADNETVPSQFMQLYKARYPNGRSVRVHNYGTPTYYSYQELMLFTKLLFEGKRPDVVVFLDGVNDFWFAQASYYNQSYFSYVLRQAFQSPGGKSKFMDTADRMYRDPQHVPPQQFYSKLAENYFTNIRNAKMMADMAGAKSYFFCQPVPFYKYPNQQQDPICFKDTGTRFNFIYPVIADSAASLPNFTFLGNMLENEKGHPFVDGLHYSPAFTRKVSEKILERIAENFQ
jgi:lysophospholipase L1-like esterase